MKIENNDSTVKTSCKNCAFAVYKDKTQIGCVHNRIEVFDESVTGAYDEYKEFYVINRFCNYYRDRAWGYSEEDVNKVEVESANTYTILIDCNDVNNKADKIIDYIRNIDYYDDKLSIILFHDSKNFDKVKNAVSYIARYCKKVVSISVLSESTSHFLYEISKKTKSYFHSVLTNFDDQGSDFATIIDKFINKELGKCFVVEYNGNVFINNHIYKAIGYMNECYSYNTIVKNLIDESHKLDRYIKL